MQRNAMQCNAMQCNAMQCNATQRNATKCDGMPPDELNAMASGARGPAATPDARSYENVIFGLAVLDGAILEVTTEDTTRHTWRKTRHTPCIS